MIFGFLFSSTHVKSKQHICFSVYSFFEYLFYCFLCSPLALQNVHLHILETFRKQRLGHDEWTPLPPSLRILYREGSFDNQLHLGVTPRHSIFSYTQPLLPDVPSIFEVCSIPLKFYLPWIYLVGL